MQSIRPTGKRLALALILLGTSLLVVLLIATAAYGDMGFLSSDIGERPVSRRVIARPVVRPVATKAPPAPVVRREPPAPSGSVWDRLAACESGGSWNISTGNGYYGGLQFSMSSWRAVGGRGNPAHASKAEQIRRAEKLRAQGGWGHWPACSRRLGLR